MGVEILDNGTRVLTAPGATFGTDALLLARFAQPRRNERALDLCSGCGIVSLVWHDAGHRGPCTALEIDPAASALCAAALAENTDAAHIAPVCGDLRQLCTAGPEQGQYDFAACNPPYFTAGPRSPDPRRAEARHTGSCTTADGTTYRLRHFWGRTSVVRDSADGAVIVYQMSAGVFAAKVFLYVAVLGWIVSFVSIWYFAIRQMKKHPSKGGTL